MRFCIENQLACEGGLTKTFLQRGWCGHSGTVEDLQAKLQQKQEGVIKRERALAYANQCQVSNTSPTLLGRSLSVFPLLI